jgi:DNA recombination-dependent growth factor C
VQNGFIAREIIARLATSGHEIVACVHNKLLENIPHSSSFKADFTKAILPEYWVPHLKDIELLIQSHHHLVIVDNGSNEETTALLKLVSLIDSHIHIIFNAENRHLAIARNQALDWIQDNSPDTELVLVLDKMLNYHITQ